MSLVIKSDDMYYTRNLTWSTDPNMALEYDDKEAQKAMKVVQRFRRHKGMKLKNGYLSFANAQVLRRRPK